MTNPGWALAEKKRPQAFPLTNLDGSSRGLELSEQLARKGREGAEQITDTIGGSFESILLAYQNGGGLLKFGGDSLLLWFPGEDHVERACRATVLMRRVLDDVGRIELPGAQVTLGMSQGVHTGHFHFFAVGTSHVEFLPVGPAWSRLVAMEREAAGGEMSSARKRPRFCQPTALATPRARECSCDKSLRARRGH